MIKSTKNAASAKLFNEKSQKLARFADYFVICGLDYDSGLEVNNFGESNLNVSPLDRSYKCKPLIHYPKHVAYNPFDGVGICMLSLPQGLKFRTQKHDITPKFHSFATTRDDGKRCYGFSLVFYEEIRNEKICTAMQMLQSMYIAELSSGATSLRKQKEPVSRSLPRHFKISADDEKHPTQAALSFYDIQKDSLYVTKSITLVCQFPYAHVAEVFLKNLYRCLPRTPGCARLSLESYVYNILYDVKIPDFGKSIRIYLPPDKPDQAPQPILLQRPKVNELPLLDFPLRCLFEYLGVECVIELFTCVLLENQVLLKSEDYQKLTIVAECITSLLFPFEWPHVYAPILPTALHHFLDAPVPFVMGLHAELLEMGNNKIGTEATLCYVDIDNKTIQLPEEMPQFPQKQDFIDEICEVLAKFEIPYERITTQNTPQNSNDFEPTILNPKNLLKNNNFYFSPSSSDKYSNIQYQRLTPQSSSNSGATLTIPKSRKKKHSLHDFLNDFDYSSPSSSPNDRSSLEENIQNSAISSTSQKLRTSSSNSSTSTVSKNEEYFNDLRLNAEIRDVFLNRFCQIFLAYEQFVILPNQSKDEWLKNRESLHNFDKASFLSDQTQQHRPFLVRFLESQMFATLIDNKIMTSFDDKINNDSAGDKLEDNSFDMHVNKNLQLFDNRIKILKKCIGSSEENSIRSQNYINFPSLYSSKNSLEKRLKSFDLEVSPPTEILRNSPAYYLRFPLLESSVLNQESTDRPNSLRRVKKKSDDDRKHQFLEKKTNSLKFYLKEIDIDKHDKSSNSNDEPGSSHNISEDKNSNTELTKSEFSASFLAQTNWSFVEKLLKEVKVKTKRMLLEKIDMEVGGNFDMEENSLITSLCDLLEKIWSHGLQQQQQQSHSHSPHTRNHYHNNHQVKSPFWAHLLRYFEKMTRENSENDVNLKNNESAENLASTALAWSVMRKRMDYLSSLKVEPQFESSFRISSPSASASPTASLQRRQIQQKSRRSKSCEKHSLLSSDIVENILPKLPETIEFDVRNILAMHEIKTDIGYARAFVRLTLEKKTLSRHLKTLLADATLLRTLYKRNAFLRCDDEKEQFLYHLLTLNAVEYFCFTQVYAMTKLPYRILIIPVSGTGTLTRKSSAIPKLWLTVFGSFGETERIHVNQCEMLLEHKNLGLLTTLRIGIDVTQNNSTLSTSTKWHLDCVWVRNEMTGHAYKFPCNRWLGRGIDDGSLERLLIGQLVKSNNDPMDNEFSFGTMSDKSPSVHSKNVNSSPSSMNESYSSTNNSFSSDRISREESKCPNEIQNNLSDSVNKIVKWFYRRHRRLQNGADSSSDSSALTNLLCGDGGFVECLTAAFMFSFRSQRLFGRNFSLWDYFVKCKDEFEQNLIADTLATIGNGESSSNDESLVDVWRDYCHLIDEITKNSTNLGWDEKYQLFICLCLKEHLLARLLPALAATRTTSEMYEEKSFLRQKTLQRFLFQILQPLSEFPFNLDNSITSGLLASTY